MDYHDVRKELEMATREESGRVAENAGDASRPSLSIVVPVFNAEATLAELVARVASVLSAEADVFEVVLVNDGSADGSWQRITELASAYPFVRGLDLTRNFGQHNALLAGIRAARHCVVVTMDDDLQHPPEEIPRLVRQLTQGRDVVYGVPRRDSHPSTRNLASWTMKRLLRWVLGAEVASMVSAFRVFRSELRHAFGAFESPFLSIDVLLAWATTRYVAVPVEHHPRSHGRSNYTFGKLVAHALNMVTGFSTIPLRLASWLGFAATCLGLGVLGYVVVRYFVENAAPPGFPFLASIVSIFSGIQLFSLGIIGEYLARMHHRSMGRPSYLVRRVTS